MFVLFATAKCFYSISDSDFNKQENKMKVEKNMWMFESSQNIPVGFTQHHTWHVGWHNSSTIGFKYLYKTWALDIYIESVQINDKLLRVHTPTHTHTHKCMELAHINTILDKEIETYSARDYIHFNLHLKWRNNWRTKKKRNVDLMMAALVWKHLFSQKLNKYIQGD